MTMLHSLCKIVFSNKVPGWFGTTLNIQNDSFGETDYGGRLNVMHFMESFMNHLILLDDKYRVPPMGKTILDLRILNPY